MKAAVSGLGAGGAGRQGEGPRPGGGQEGGSGGRGGAGLRPEAPKEGGEGAASRPLPHPGAVVGGCSCTVVLNSSRSTSSTSWPRQPPGCVTTDTPTTLPATSTCRVSWSERCDSTREHWGGEECQGRGARAAVQASPTQGPLSLLPHHGLPEASLKALIDPCSPGAQAQVHPPPRLSPPAQETLEGKASHGSSLCINPGAQMVEATKGG